MDLQPQLVSDVEAPYKLFAWTLLHKRVRSLRKRVRRLNEAASPETIHRTRVASRRLRTAMEILADVLPERKSKSWTKPVNKLSRRLGAARDTDVQIELVNGLLTGPPAPRHRIGLECLHSRLTRRRQKNAKSVAKAVASMEYGANVGRLQKWLKRKLPKAEPAAQAETPPQVDLTAPVVLMEESPAQPAVDQTLPQPQAAKVKLKALPPLTSDEQVMIARRAAPGLLSRLDFLLSYAPVVRQPEQVERLHEMRIAAKHLRYALEMFASVFDDKVRQGIDAAKHLQDLLGEIHDADVWQQELPRLLVKEIRRAIKHPERKPSVTNIRPGIEFVRRQRAEYRAQRYAEFTEFWDQKSQEGLWGDLRALLEAARDAAPATEVKEIVEVAELAESEN